MLLISGREPARKDLSTGPIDKQLERELFNSGTARGINFDKYDEIPVQLSKNESEHKQFDQISQFSQFNLQPSIMRNVQLSDYEKPTPVQKHGIPSLLLGWDLMACAQTGSGKTAAYLLPIISNMITRGPKPFRRGVKDWQVLENRHIHSKELHRDSVRIIERRPCPVWRVESDMSSQSYLVTLEEECCSCVVRCRQCGVCAKMYSCTCTDYSHRGVACKHIHLVHSEFGAIGVDPLTLILAPTRELVMQIHREARKFSYRTAMASAMIYGGHKYLQQIDHLKHGCDILVATPGRLLNAIESGHLSLADCRFLVLDEADKMLEMGFKDQICQVVEHMPMEEDRQTVMFSATFDDEIQVLAQDILVTDYDVFAVGRIGTTTENITQNVISVQYSEKNQLLIKLLKESNESGCLTLVFFNTKKRTKNMANVLIAEDFNVVALHSKIRQNEREHNLDQFRKGIAPVLCATDVAARGLDIPHVDLVINYDMPDFRREGTYVQPIEQYVHRIGRTGRNGNKGEAISFFVDYDGHIGPDLVDLMLDAQQKIPYFLSKYHKKPGGKNKKKFGGFFAGRGGNSKRRENEWGERED